MIFEKTEVLFCYGTYPILILMKSHYCIMKTPIVKPVALKRCLYSDACTAEGCAKPTQVVVFS
jgi:hypothetical protein